MPQGTGIYLYIFFQIKETLNEKCRKDIANMSKKSRDRDHKDTTFSDEDYSTLDIASNTEMTGAAMRPPLTDAEAENYGDIIPMPQQRATHADGKGQKCKREEKL